MIRKFGWAVAAMLAVGTVGAASAADMAVKARPVLVYNWTGCYIGLSAGAKGAYPTDRATIPGATGGAITTATSAYDFGRDSDDQTWLAGGQAGCNYQAAGSPWVFGVEVDGHAQHWSETNIVQFPPAGSQFVAGDNFSLASDWQASARARVGYAFDRTLFYVTGGAAFTNVRATTNWIAVGIFPATFMQQDKYLTGGTVGVGVEYAVTNNFSVGLEGRYTDYESKRFDAGPLAVIATGGAFVRSATYRDVGLETGEILFKANYKFGGPGPVVAKY